MVEYDIPGDFSCVDEETGDMFNPENGELMLGDIVISKERVIAQAEEYGHSVKREYAFLIAHSMLHLFGYDHMEEGERAVMGGEAAGDHEDCKYSAMSEVSADGYRI